MPSRSLATALLRTVLAATAALVALPGLVSSAPAVASAPVAATTTATVPAAAALAAGWLAGERDGDGSVPGPFAGTDWGLSVDTLWAMEAGGASAADLQHSWSAIAAHASELSGPPSWSSDPTLRYGGGTAKVLVAAESVGADPRAVRTGGATHDLVAATLERVRATGPQAGRVEDSASAGFDSTNVFGQALAVIGLSDAGLAAGPDAATLRSAVGFLTTQQCAPGWFRIFVDDQTCDAALAAGDAAGDVDATAMAVQALVAARAAGVAVGAGAVDAASGWLVAVQHADGSFGGGTGTSGSNANSTGLAAVALEITGHPASADRARTWVTGLQLGATTGPLAVERGAIAYDPAALVGADAHGISDTGRDQWRRSTAQAIFALNPVGLARLADLPAGGGLPTPPTPPTPPVTTPPTTPGDSATSTPPVSSTTSTSTRPPEVPAPASTVGLPPTRPGQISRGNGSSTPSASVGSRPTGSSTSPSAAGLAAPTVPPATAASSDAAAPLASAATAAETAAPDLWRSPLVLAIVIGILLGALVVLRPWRLLGGRAR